MKELLAEIVKRLVDHPDQVMINEIDSKKMTALEISVAMEDLGKFIGLKGRNINAIRTIMASVSRKIKKRILVEVV